MAKSLGLDGEPERDSRQSEALLEGGGPKTNMVLLSDLVPKTSWFDNLRKVMPRASWDVLRRKVYAQYGNRCGICRANAKLDCHEIWSYDDASHTQTLRGFIALCAMCHHVKHLGLASVLASKGRLNYASVVVHFCRVNGCDKAAFDAHKTEAFKVWKERSQFKWTVDLGEWVALVPEVRRTKGLPAAQTVAVDGLAQDAEAAPLHTAG